MSRLLRTLSCAALLLVFSHVAEGASPSVGIIQPRGGQRGAELALLFNGGNLQDAQEVVFHSPGFSVTKLEVVNPNQVKATVKIGPDARLGEHAMRIRCASGISEMRTFWVGALPTVDEKEPNGDFAAPQKINLNVTVHGVVDNEDVDYFAVEAKKGQRISVEVEAMRLGNQLFDPFVAILNTKRFELATSDDTALLKQDGCLSLVAPEDGTYIVQIRETSYGGNGGCQYRLHVGTFPRPVAVVPSGGKLGEEVEVRFIGDASGEIKQKVKLPSVAPEDGDFRLHCETPEGISPSGIPFRLSTVGNCVEVEPNDSHPQATKGEFPCAFNGVIDKPGDVDCFKFAAKKGQVFDVHCFARRLGSELDPVMYLQALNGGNVAGNDDAVGPDSYFRATIPNDGEYVILIHDHLRKGGPTYSYRVELNPVEVLTNLGVPKVALYSQERQSFAIPRGNRFATLINASRVNWGGDLSVTLDNLPGKVTYQTEPMAGNMSVVPVVLEAPADAPISGTLTKVDSKPVDPKLNFPSKFSIDAEYTIGNPGQSIYWRRYENRVSVAVTEEVPFKIQIVEPKVPLVHGGSMQLKIVAERAKDFKAAITVVPLYNPPGVGSVGSVTIPEGQTEALFLVNANGGAPVRKWKYAVLGVSNAGKGPVWVSSQLATIEITPPYMQLALERGAVEQGKPTQMFVKLTNTKPFAGKAVMRLIGLPPKVTTKELEIDKDTKEIAFPLSVEPTAPAGIHKNLFCQVVVTENGEPVVHSLGGSELRIDVPIPPKPNEAPKPATAQPAPAAPKPNDPPMKRLSRLEQLRLEQEEREKAQKQGGETPKKEEPKKQ
jgi:hypothetical protein